MDHDSKNQINLIHSLTPEQLKMILNKDSSILTTNLLIYIISTSSFKFAQFHKQFFYSFFQKLDDLVQADSSLYVLVQNQLLLCFQKICNLITDWANRNWTDMKISRKLPNNKIFLRIDDIQNDLYSQFNHEIYLDLIKCVSKYCVKYDLLNLNSLKQLVSVLKMLSCSSYFILYDFIEQILPKPILNDFLGLFFEEIEYPQLKSLVKFLLFRNQLQIPLCLLGKRKVMLFRDESFSVDERDLLLSYFDDHDLASFYEYDRNQILQVSLIFLKRFIPFLLQTCSDLSKLITILNNLQVKDTTFNQKADCVVSYWLQTNKLDFLLLISQPDQFTNFDLYQGIIQSIIRFLLPTMDINLFKNLDLVAQWEIIIDHCIQSDSHFERSIQLDLYFKLFSLISFQKLQKYSHILLDPQTQLCKAISMAVKYILWHKTRKQFNITIFFDPHYDAVIKLLYHSCQSKEEMKIKCHNFLQILHSNGLTLNDVPIVHSLLDFSTLQKMFHQIRSNHIEISLFDKLIYVDSKTMVYKTRRQIVKTDKEGHLIWKIDLPSNNIVKEFVYLDFVFVVLRSKILKIDNEGRITENVDPKLKLIFDVFPPTESETGLIVHSQGYHRLTMNQDSGFSLSEIEDNHLKIESNYELCKFVGKDLVMIKLGSLDQFSFFHEHCLSCQKIQSSLACVDSFWFISETKLHCLDKNRAHSVFQLDPQSQFTICENDFNENNLVKIIETTNNQRFLAFSHQLKTQ